jgi:hypothetical protein
MCSGADLSLAAMYLAESFRDGRATADAFLNRSYAASACGIKPQRGPLGALPWANSAF